MCILVKTWWSVGRHPHCRIEHDWLLFSFRRTDFSCRCKTSFHSTSESSFFLFHPSLLFHSYYHHHHHHYRYQQHVARSTSTNTRHGSRWSVQVSFLLVETGELHFDRCCRHSSRFIINIPSEQREDLVRVLFAVELAHWFFIDFYCEDYNDLHVCNIKDFAQQSERQLPSRTFLLDGLLLFI